MRSLFLKFLHEIFYYLGGSALEDIIQTKEDNTLIFESRLYILYTDLFTKPKYYSKRVPNDMRRLFHLFIKLK